MGPRGDRIELKIPQRLEYLGPIRVFFEGIARDVGFPENDIEKIVMSVDEALSNSISYSRDNDEPLWITIELTLEALSITIVDAGDDYRDRFQKNVELDEHLREMRQNGLGLHIIKTFMDHVKYNRTSQEKNHLTLVKFLPR